MKHGFRVFITILVLAAGSGWLYYQSGLRPLDSNAKSKLVCLPQGEGIWAIASTLEREKIIRSAPVFYIAYRQYILRGHDGKLSAKYYDLSPADSVGKIITVRLHEPADRWVTFAEGLRIEQMAQKVAEGGLSISKQGFIKAAGNPGAVADAVDFRLPKGDLEGYLFPDTYQFVVGMEPSGVVRTMVKTFGAKFAGPHATAIKKSPYTLHELVTIASLIEREARVDKDRKLISSVIHNRLKQGMRLQIDATVQYALPEHKKRLKHSDLKVDSP